jgi:hypothetical protein
MAAIPRKINNKRSFGFLKSRKRTIAEINIAATVFV